MRKKIILQKSHYTTLVKSHNTTHCNNLLLQQSHITTCADILKKSLFTTCITAVLCILVFSLNTTCIYAATPERDADSDAYMLQKMAVAEAEDQGVWGQALVMQTILNRVESPDFPDNVYDVLFEENQFTSISNGRYDECEPNEISQQAYELLESMRNEGQTYFEKSQNYETWHSKNLEKVAEYRDHIFYKIPGGGNEKKN